MDRVIFYVRIDDKIPSIEIPLTQVVRKYTENYTDSITYTADLHLVPRYTYMHIEPLPPNLIGMRINTRRLTEAAINYPSVTRNAV